MAFTAGTALITVLPDAGLFTKALSAKLLPGLRTAETQAAGLGKSLLTAATSAPVLGAGIAAVGIASVKLAVDFQAAMTRIVSLVGIGRAEVDRMSESVLELAKGIPEGPTELANALFFITSAGQRGAQAMETLRVSSEAAAAGLGDTQTVADAVTSAMNAYAGSGLTAAHATDILIAAVREGKLEPAALAASLGQVLPVATQVGVSLDQVAAAIASATRQGVDAGRAATGVRFLLSSFIKPSTQAVDALNAVGFSIGDLQRALASQGLLATLQVLAERFDLTTARGKQMFAQVVGGARGMSVAGVLVGKNWQAVQGVFENVTNSAGSLERAFAAAQQTIQFKFRALISTLQVAGVRIGTALLPAVGKIVDVLAIAANNADALFVALIAFTGLKFLPALFTAIAVALDKVALGAAAGGALKLSYAFAGLAAAAGPLALILGAATLAGNKLNDVFFKNVVSTADAAAGIKSNLTEALRSGAITMDQLRTRVERYNESIGRLPGATQLAASAFVDLTRGGKDMPAIIAAGGAALARMRVEAEATHLDVVAQDSERLKVSLVGIAPALDAMGTSMGKFQKDAATAFAESAKDETAWGKFTKDTLSSAREAFAQWRTDAASSLDLVSAKFGEVASDFKGSASTIAANLRRALTAEREFGKDLAKIAEDGTRGSKLLIQQLIALGPAGVNAAHAIAGATDSTRASIEESLAKGQAFASDLASSLQTKILGTLGDIRSLLQQLAKTWGITMDVDKSQADAALTALRTRIAELVALNPTINVGILLRTGGGLDLGLGTATGFHGQVDRPTLFLAGEAGSERVDVTPRGGGGGTGSGRISGQLAITDWHRGVAVLDAELDNIDRTSGR